MSAHKISNVVLLFPNIEWPATDTDSDLFRSVAQLRPNISYAEDIDENIRTLSTHNSPASGIIQGFLYVPDLLASDPCTNISKQYIPSNVTRQANLPPTDFTLVALAPWINAECTKSYLAAARLDPMRAFIFYLPDNSTEAPPLTNSPAWGLQDGGQWRSANPYPVYAIPGATGARMMDKLSLYSGNLTNVPFGHQIAELPDIDIRDYVRIFSQISVPTSSSMPGVWAFILIVAAVLVTMLALTSATMHIVQIYRRKSLYQRVVSGEVDLEALGIKRLTVPEEIINKMPLFTYNCESEEVQATVMASQTTDVNTTQIGQHGSSEGLSAIGYEMSPGHDRYEEITATDLTTPTSKDVSTSNSDSIFTHKFLPYSQPTCPICLDDYESGVTTIRELPCGHIFHPECIDTFLCDNSSLCPMCKKSVLPRGYCATKITNNMVRRERNMRRLRARVTISDNGADVETGISMKRLQDWRHSIRRRILQPAYTRAPPQVSSPISLQHEEHIMSSAISSEAHASVLGSQVPQPLSPGLSRQEIAERRVRELAAAIPVPAEDPDIINERQRSKWRRSFAKAFPGFA